MSCRSKMYSKMHPDSCTNTHHDVRDLVNHELIKRTVHDVSMKQKNSYPVPQIANSEKLLFCEGGNL